MSESLLKRIFCSLVLPLRQPSLSAFPELDSCIFLDLVMMSLFVTGTTQVGRDPGVHSLCLECTRAVFCELGYWTIPTLPIWGLEVIVSVRLGT